LGSKATPKSPRAQVEATERVIKGVVSKIPFLITLNAPVCEQTNMRPSGAIAIATGDAIPLATVVSIKPAGSVAPETEKTDSNIATIGSLKTLLTTLCAHKAQLFWRDRLRLAFCWRLLRSPVEVVGSPTVHQSMVWSGGVFLNGSAGDR
jgi:hypothetical protein